MLLPLVHKTKTDELDLTEIANQFCQGKWDRIVTYLVNLIRIIFLNYYLFNLKSILKPTLTFEKYTNIYRLYI